MCSLKTDSREVCADSFQNTLSAYCKISASRVQLVSVSECSF
jgi:hypothetical protein